MTSKGTRRAVRARIAESISDLDLALDQNVSGAVLRKRMFIYRASLQKLQRDVDALVKPIKKEAFSGGSTWRRVLDTVWYAPLGLTSGYLYASSIPACAFPTPQLVVGLRTYGWGLFIVRSRTIEDGGGPSWPVVANVTGVLLSTHKSERDAKDAGAAFALREWKAQRAAASLHEAMRQARDDSDSGGYRG